MLSFTVSQLESHVITIVRSSDSLLNALRFLTGALNEGKQNYEYNINNYLQMEFENQPFTVLCHHNNWILF